MTNRRDSFLGMSGQLRSSRPQSEEKANFREFAATSLFCPKCKQAMPIRAQVLLVLSDGELIDYCCQKCGTSLGTRKGGGYDR